MNALLIAWKASRVVPVGTVRVLAALGADYAWRRPGKAVQRLEENLHRVTGLEGRALRDLSKRSLQSVARYYAEALTLNRFSSAQIEARVRVENFQHVEATFAGLSTGAVAVLSHSGNWDLVGAYASPRILPVTAVAEVLKPREMFDQFVAMREAVGIRVLGLEGGSTFPTLVRIAMRERALICLLADRDLTGSGIDVDMWGQGVTVAPGPAALAVATGAPLVPVHVRYERLTGARRRAAGSPWGVVLTFGQILRAEDVAGTRDEKVASLTQQWATWMATMIAAHPQDWHMLQRFGWTS